MTPVISVRWGLAALAWGVILARRGPLALLLVMCTEALITGLPSVAAVLYALCWLPTEHLAASWMVMVLAMM